MNDFKTQNIYATKKWYMVISKSEVKQKINKDKKMSIRT